MKLRVFLVFMIFLASAASPLRLVADVVSPDASVLSKASPPNPSPQIVISPGDVSQVDQAKSLVEAGRYSEAKALLLAMPDPTTSLATTSAIIRKCAAGLKYADSKGAAALDAKAAEIDVSASAKADDLDDEAGNLLGVSDWSTSFDLTQQALALQIPVDKAGRSKSFRIAAIALCGQGKIDAAVEDARQALALGKAAGDTDAQGNALCVIGFACMAKFDYAKAIDSFAGALPLLRAAGDTDAQAQALTNSGMSCLRLNRFAQSLDFYEHALPMFHSVGDQSDEAQSLYGAGDACLGLSRNADAIAYFDKAITIYHALGDDDSAAYAWMDSGVASTRMHENAKAIKDFNQVQALCAATGDTDGEGRGLINLGNVRINMSEFKVAIDCYNKALPLFAASDDKDGEGLALMDSGIASTDLSDFDTAVGDFNRALPLFKVVGDTANRAKVQINGGSVYLEQGQFAKAIECYKEVLPIFRSAGDKPTEGLVLMDIGLARSNLSQDANALTDYDQALAIFRGVGDANGEAKVLSNRGSSYVRLGQYDRAIGDYDQALPIFHNSGDKDAEALTLMNIGLATGYLNRPSDAIGYYNQALPIFQSIGDRDGEAKVLVNAGNANSLLTKNDAALDQYNQALPVLRAIGDKTAEALTLMDIGALLSDQHQYAKALDYYNQALPIYRFVGDRNDEGTDLSDLMDVCRELGSKDVAVLYGKQAVNIYQAIRGESVRLSNQIQAGYLVSKERTYRRLAHLLVALGRLPEAEQVLGMLKQQEFFDYIGGSRDDATKLDATVAFTAAEQAWIDKYAGMREPVDALQSDIDALDKSGKTATPEYKLKEAQLASASDAFQSFLAELPKRFADNANGQGKADQLLDSAGSAALLKFLEAAAAKGIRVAALFTIESDTQYDVVMVTSSGAQQPGAYPINSSDLNAKVEAFRTAVQNRRADPRPLGKQLYDILIGPIAKPLAIYRPDVVMWSLDGTLGMVPVSALWDGRQYLVQRWQSVSFDPASLPDMAGHVLTGAIGYGVSQSRTVGRDQFAGLPGVPAEMRGIFRDPAHAATGPVPGRYYLDTQFRSGEVISALRLHDHRLVHIATHFKLDPATAANSYLLTGDGTLSLFDLRRIGSVFRDVDLLTLSACSTAVQTSGIGSERNGLDATASLLGARSILATLWSVNDASTATMMRIFYGKMAANPSMSISEALREAQLTLLNGSPAPSSTDRGSASQIADDKTRSLSFPPSIAGGQPLFTPDPKAPFAHPYFWAPFVLLGSWK